MWVCLHGQDHVNTDDKVMVRKHKKNLTRRNVKSTLIAFKANPRVSYIRMQLRVKERLRQDFFLNLHFDLTLLRLSGQQCLNDTRQLVAAQRCLPGGLGRGVPSSLGDLRLVLPHIVSLNFYSCEFMCCF